MAEKSPDQNAKKEGDETPNVATQSAQRVSIARLLGVAAVLGIGTGALALYVNGPPNGNVESASSCSISEERRLALDSAAQGEVAAFAVVDDARAVPEMQFADDSGAIRSISDWAGRTVLFNLWATWCAPCREEMPMLDNLQAEHGGEDFEVVAVSIDTRESANPQGFLQEISVDDLAFYQDDSAELFQVLRAEGLAFGMPTTLLIDDSGCLQGFLAGPAHWDHADAVALIEAAKTD
ncbi:MAG: TlpA disulfide reductase family protein [Pseudomonadota bacterium]